MGFRTKDLVAAFVFNLIHYAYSADRILSCNVTELEPCPYSHMLCNQTSQTCECIAGYVRESDGYCVEEGDEGGPGHRTAGLVAVAAATLLIVGLFLIVRKYKLLEYLRHKINLRRNNDIMYEDVMIGQDDPPLSP